MDTFYTRRDLTIEDKTAILNDAYAVNTVWWVDDLQGWTRRRINMPFEDIMKKLDMSCHFVVIHRRPPAGEEHGEIGFSTMKGPFSYYLWIYTTLDGLAKIITDYNLIQQE